MTNFDIDSYIPIFGRQSYNIPIFQGKQEMLNSYLKYERINYYWRNTFSMKMEDGKTKYKCLPEMVKSALILPHGNTDVERSLSVNTSVVTEDRPHIGEATVCAFRTVKDAVQSAIILKKSPSLRSAKMAYASYRQRPERHKEEKERQLKQQELAKAEKKQTRKRKA